MSPNDAGAPRGRQNPRPRHRPHPPEREKRDVEGGVADSHAAAPTNTTPPPRPSRLASTHTNPAPDELHANRRFIVEDIGDLAKIGGDLLKRTMSSGFEVIKEVKEGLPKEATQLINKGKEEVLKGLSKEVMQNVLAATVDRFFSVVREHKLDITVSVRLKKAENGVPTPDPHRGTETRPHRNPEHERERHHDRNHHDPRDR